MEKRSGSTLNNQPLSKPDEEYVQISRLGKGSEGYVYLCRKFVKKKKKISLKFLIKKTGELFAMKKIEIEDEESIKKDQMVFFFQ